MTRTPSRETSAVAALPEPEPCPFCSDRDGGCLRCTPPPWAEELLQRVKRIEGSLALLANAYKVQAQDIALLRQHCPECPPNEIPVSGD